MNSNDLQRFNGYANNILIKIFNCFKENKLDLIDHFLGDKVYKKIEEKIKENNKEFNNFKINTFYISNIKEKDDCYILEYYVSFSYDEIKEENIKEINREYMMIFIKNKDTKNRNEIIKCLNCGSNMDINNNGKCEYCGSIYNLEDYDWILDDVKNV